MLLQLPNGGTGAPTAAGARKNLGIDLVVLSPDDGDLDEVNTNFFQTVLYNGSIWKWTTGNYATEVAADTVGALFVKGKNKLTSAGAWIRQGYKADRVKFSWFGVPTTGDATTLFNTMLTICNALNVEKLEADEGATYNLENATFPDASFDIEGNNCIFQGTYSAASSSQNIVTATSGTTASKLAFRNIIFDGGWTSGAATSYETVINISGYDRLDFENCTVRDCNGDGSTGGVEIFTRLNLAVKIMDVGATYVDGLVMDGSRRYEMLNIFSSTGTHVAHLKNCNFSGHNTSGSALNIANLRVFTMGDSIMDGWPGGPNVFAKNVHFSNVVFRNMADNGLDLSEGLWYSDNGVVENCVFEGVDETALLVSGNVTSRNNTFTDVGLPIRVNTALAADALSGAYGSWVAQVELPSNFHSIDDNFAANIDGAPTGGFPNANIFVAGTSTNPTTVRIEASQKQAATGITPEYFVEARHIKSLYISGTVYDGSVAMVRHDLGDGEYWLDANFNVGAAADVFLLNRAAAATTTATVHWLEGAKRVGTLGGSNFDISLGTSNGFNAIYAYGPNQPVLDTGIPATVPTYRNYRDTQTVATNAAFTLTVGSSGTEILHTGTLTANRLITLDTASAYAGACFRITRTGSGAFNLDVGGLKNLVQNTWCEVIYDGSAWYLSEYGILADVQPLDADLTALANNATNGLWARTGAGTGLARTITGTANRIAVSEGAGTSGNPTIDISANYVGQATITTTGALNSGSITSGFGSIDIGADALTAGATSVTTLSITQGGIISGTYTPTVTLGVNAAASVAAEAQYIRVGNVVTVSGSITIDPTTAAATATQVTLTLPVASNLGDATQLAGVGFSNDATNTGMRISGSSASDVAVLDYFANQAGNRTWAYTYTYRII